MKDSVELSLTSGRTTQGIVRIGNTVHRPVGENSDFIHSLLKLLENKNFQFSPRFLGIDEKGREILTFIEGIVPHGEVKLTEENLSQCANALRTFHDLTEESRLAEPYQVVCHTDFAPWNMVLNEGSLVGIIDFDDSTPGERLDDLAYFIWTALDLGSDTPFEQQVRRIKIICDAYGLSKRQSSVDSILKQQENILNKRKVLSENDLTQEVRDFSKSKVPEIQKQISWVKKYKQDLENSI